MYGIMKLALVAASVVAPLVGASPLSPSLSERQASSASWWLGAIDHTQGHPLIRPNPSSYDTAVDTTYKVFRNVKDYGAKGDGTTDDTNAIQTAIDDGKRCGQGCNSTTTQPALVFFPAGTYMVNSSITMDYFTQLVGDATNKPIIKAMAGLTGLGMLDSDPYIPGGYGANFWINQNNFYRQVRNFVLDITEAAQGVHAIHWQVAQATSLYNIDFKMTPGMGHVGIYMDNGSSQFSDKLTFDGGDTCAYFGNQQFTTRNMNFTNCGTAILMNWNWLWTLKSINIAPSCKYGVNMSGTGDQNVGSVLIQDSTISASVYGVSTAYDATNPKSANGTLVIDNVNFAGTPAAVIDFSGKTILQGGGLVSSFVQGFAYTTGTPSNGTVATRASNGQQAVQGTFSAATKASGLLDKNGKVVEVEKPQYTEYTSAQIVSAKAQGAKGDGVTDDTSALNTAIAAAAQAGNILYMDHGAYLIKDTLKIPAGAKIVGEAWPVLLVDGQSFNDPSNLKVAIQVGEKGSTGSVQMQDLVFSTKGNARGAIMMEWNIDASSTGGLFDCHFRIGGSVASAQGVQNCARTAAGSPQPTPDASALPGASGACYGADTLFHLTSSGSGYFENVWAWVADHDLDVSGSSDYQINIYNGRGLLIETQKPSWFVGTASEHSQLYNYAFNGAANIYLGAIQTETAYMQGGSGGVPADQYFPPQKTNAADPDFSTCDASDTTCKMTWGARFINSMDIFVYGAGLYSFFNDYSESCLVSQGGSDNCQKNMVYLDDCSSDVYLYGLTTKAAVNMVTVGTEGAALGADNPSTFGDTVALFEYA